MVTKRGPRAKVASHGSLQQQPPIPYSLLSHLRQKVVMIHGPNTRPKEDRGYPCGGDARTASRVCIPSLAPFCLPTMDKTKRLGYRMFARGWRRLWESGLPAQEAVRCAAGRWRKQSLNLLGVNGDASRPA
jgi:hypothetical protein